ncbi:DUF6262 family protein [Streptomyces sp. NPDC002763]|uniref:DUF6262 family protein n=1 Tax=Streptomyces sp. NPDC002763 TaxID=3154427 RepID=UPI00331CE1B0
MNSAPMPELRTAAALAARRRKTEAALERVHQTIARLRREKAQVSFAVVARRAHISRTFLYDNVEARAAVAAAMTQAGERRSRTFAEQDDECEATWRERALNAEDGFKAARTEILAQRARIGELLVQIRDLEAEWTDDAVQKITAENATVKQRVRRLTADNRTLDERLKAARSNLRFQDAVSPTSKPTSRRPPADDSYGGLIRGPGHRGVQDLGRLDGRLSDPAALVKFVGQARVGDEVSGDRRSSETSRAEGILARARC